MGQPRPPDRLESIDALRGLAAVAVVLYHARAILWVGVSALYAKYGLRHWDPGVWLGYATTPLRFGGLGVPLFFVLSGYCIHRPAARRLAADPGTRLAPGAFYRRRFWRIYPTYVAALLLSGLSDATVGPLPEKSDPFSLSPYALLVSLLSLQGYLAPQFSSNGVFWTLAVEIHFYLLYPLLYAVSRRVGPGRALALTFAAQVLYLAVARATGLHFPDAGSGGGPVFLAYWFTWATGFYLAEAEAGRAALPGPGWRAALALAGVGLIAVAGRIPVAGVAEFGNALAFGGLVWWSLGGPGRRFWARAPGRLLAWVGAFSYSLYAIHVPCLTAFRALTNPTGERPESLAPFVLGVLIAVAGAWLLFQAVERWSIRTPARAPDHAAP